jgi:hypothetical protein
LASLDVLVLNSGDWILAGEVAAAPAQLLIYRQRGEPRNELHLWLPGPHARRTCDRVLRRFWMEDGVRWCVESPEDVARLRFTDEEGGVLWAERRGARRLGDLTDAELGRLLRGARPEAATLLLPPLPAERPT